ncbi:hypothetical protein K8I85_13550 [bacterium]|nr:hypothetical protein [bacterium]
MRMGLWAALSALAVGALASGCGSDGDGNGDGTTGPVTAPAEWVGRWAGTIEESACTGRLGAVAEPDTFSICEGDQGDPGSDIGTECTTSWDANSLTFNCGGSITAEGCTLTSSASATVTRSGDTMTFQWQFEVAYSGACGDAVGACEQTTGTYTRISPTPDPDECDSIGFDPLLPRLSANPTAEERLAAARNELRDQFRHRLLNAVTAAW